MLQFDLVRYTSHYVRGKLDEEINSLIVMLLLLLRILCEDDQPKLDFRWPNKNE